MVVILLIIIFVLVGIIASTLTKLVIDTTKVLDKKSREEQSLVNNINNGNNEENKELYTEEEIEKMIGKYVNYTPDRGTYSKITGNDNYTGDSNNRYDFVTENLNFRIWNIEDKKLILIADDVIKTGGIDNRGSLEIAGAVGYNNAVQILNDIAKNCYSNSKMAAVGRSLNIEDIEKVIDKDKWKPENYSDTINGIKFNTYSGLYNYDKTRYYPYIYQFEKNAKIDGAKKGTIARSVQPSQNSDAGYYTGSAYSREQASSSIEVTQTYWAEAQNLLTAIDANHYKLLFYNGANSELNFYLASRFVRTAVSREAYFGVQEVEKRNVSGLNLFGSNGGMLSVARSVRPVVEIDLTRVKLDNTKSGNTVETAYTLNVI